MSAKIIETGLELTDHQHVCAECEGVYDCDCTDRPGWRIGICDPCVVRLRLEELRPKPWYLRWVA